MKNQTNVSMNSTKITSPKCGTEIDVQDIISHQLKEVFKKEFNVRLAEEKKKFEN